MEIIFETVRLKYKLVHFLIIEFGIIRFQTFSVLKVVTNKCYKLQWYNFDRFFFKK